MTRTYNRHHTLAVLPAAVYKPELYKLAEICKDMQALGIDIETVYKKLQARLLKKSEAAFEAALREGEKEDDKCTY